METAEEINIPVPWGHVAGKTIGLESGEVVLCIHGALDNAGSFDLLLPLLPIHGYKYIAIDLPGHGKSSHFPPGVPLVQLNFVYTIKLVFDFLQCKNILLLGHSFGGQLSVLFAVIYPELVRKLILIDILTPYYVKNKNLITHLRKYLDKSQEIIKKIKLNDIPVKSYAEILQKIRSNRGKDELPEISDILAKRSLIKSKDGLRLSSDKRIKNLFSYFPFNEDQIDIILDNIKCPALVIVAQETYFLGLTMTAHSQEKDEHFYFIKRLNLFKKRENFTLKIIAGDHDIHLKNVNLVARYISEFLNLVRSSL